MRVVSKRKRKYGTYKEKREFHNKKREKIEKIRKLYEDKKYVLAKKSIDNYIDDYGIDCYINHEAGKYYLRIFELEEAESWFMKNYLSDSINKYYSTYYLGKIEFFRHNFDKAINYYTEILNSNHLEKEHAMLGMAKVYNLNGDYDIAEDYLKKIIFEKNTNNNQNLFDKAVNCEMLKDFELADSYFSKALKTKNSLVVSAIEELIDISLSNDETLKAEMYYKQIKDYLPEHKKILYSAEIEADKGNIDKATNILETYILDKDDYNSKNCLKLVKIEFKNGNYDKCIEIFSLIKKDNPFYIEHLKVAIYSYIKLKNVETAKERVEELLEYGYAFLDIVNFYMGKISLLENDKDKAYEYFSNVEEKNKNLYVKTLVEKILINLKNNDLETAYIEFRKLKTFDLSYLLNISARKIEFYLLNYFDFESDLKPKYYIEYLLKNYDYDTVINHIKNHFYSNNIKKKHTIFNKEINIDSLYEFAKKNINNENLVESNFSDSYILTYPNVGYLDGEFVNQFKVITILNSDKIITMFPIINEYDEAIEFCEEEKHEEIKIKKISRIEKFNKKYNL